ncbi:prolyl aminopeptidase [Atopobacter phocae]|uniref:prolyl aminopeptidase n=1 Tax=Atopobacter phocae TaxID=136492 RepID=UPI00046EE9B2|nr:prolyl aminopeptidase [Atopobacter phocae]
MKQSLYPVIEPYQIHQLPVSDVHTIYVEESGNPNGKPVIVLHGGPGSRSNPMSRQFFDPTFYRIIQFDQRGCGKSTPFASLEENTTHHLVDDMEQIRRQLGIDQWLVMGGSWGTTLALHYAIKYPQQIIGLILRGVFLGRPSDNDWLFQEGSSYFYPELFKKFVEPITKEKRDAIIPAYYELLTSDDANVRENAARAWFEWESGITTLLPQPMEKWTGETVRQGIALATLECHYFVHNCFVEDDNYLLNRVHVLKDVPIHIVHGRYDVDCRPSGAWDLFQALPHAELIFADASGHSQAEPNILKELVRFAEHAKNYFV